MGCRPRASWVSEPGQGSSGENAQGGHSKKKKFGKSLCWNTCQNSAYLDSSNLILDSSD